MTRIVASAAARAGRGVLVDRRDDVLGGALAAEGVRPFLLGGAFEEHGGVARVGHGLDDVVALGQKAGVGGGRIQGEEDGARLHLRDHAFGDDAQDRVGDGEDHDVGLRNGVLGAGDVTAFGPDAFLAGGGVLTVEDVMRALLEVGGNTHPHLASGSDDGDGQLFC